MLAARIAGDLLKCCDMKAHLWDLGMPVNCRPLPKKTRRKSVSAILRAAYRPLMRDPHTRTAVKRCLR